MAAAVVSGGDTAPIFPAAKHVIHLMPLFIHRFVETVLELPVFTGRDT